MRLGARLLAAVGLVAGLAALAHAEPPSPKRLTPQERKRKQILDELGLEKVDKAPPPTAAPPSPLPTDQPATAVPEGFSRTAPGSSPAPAAPGPSFRRAIHPLLVQSCQVCHRAGGPAQATRFVLVGDAAADYATVRPFVSPSVPLTSPLLAKASGQTHGGGAPWPAASEAHGRVLAWISKGARLDGGPTPVAPAPTPVAVAPQSAGRRPGTVPPVAEAPAPKDEAPAPQADTQTAEPSPAAGSVAAPIATPASPPAPSVHDLLMTACAACHGPRGAAAATRLVLSGDAALDDAAARALIDPASPPRSLLLTKASGEMHGGGGVLAPTDPRRAALIAWIEAQAPQPGQPTSPAGAAPVAAAVAPTVGAPAQDVARTAAPPIATPAPHQAGGLLLPAGFLLNGRFDLAYERRQFSGEPWADGATSALRSYHHFLFLSRESATDPFGLSVEILTLQFWEAHARLGGHGRPWRLLVGGGKIIVPFGADPLTHQSYGGLAGFDQRILPPVWAQEGAAAHFTFERGRFVLTDDAFIVRGYALPRADAVLNLQVDFSPSDDVKLGWGNRLGIAWLNMSAWYSAYFNELGFGRRLFMQAADLTLWRPRSVPVLGHFSAGAGLLRADVSGGGAGLDYYQFGSYLQVRYHPTDWFFLQYRQGLRTFDNRRGVILDETRLTPEDMSTHNFAAVARYRGVTATLAYFLILEKAGELPNDFLRVSMSYDF